MVDFVQILACKKPTIEAINELMVILPLLYLPKMRSEVEYYVKMHQF